MSPRQWKALAGVSVCASAAWNGIFDFLVSRGEREYFWAQARAESGAGPPVVLHEMMAESIGYAAQVAHWWGGVTLAAGLLLVWYLRPQGAQEYGVTSRRPDADASRGGLAGG